MNKLVDLLEKTLKQKRTTKPEKSSSKSKNNLKSSQSDPIESSRINGEDQLILNPMSNLNTVNPFNISYSYWNGLWSQPINFYGFPQGNMANEYFFLNKDNFSPNS